MLSFNRSPWGHQGQGSQKLRLITYLNLQHVQHEHNEGSLVSSCSGAGWRRRGGGGGGGGDIWSGL